MAEINDILSRYYPLLESLACGDRGGFTALEARRYGGVLKSLQRGLTGDRLLVGASYFSEADFLGAYLLYYWPVSFLQTYLALEEMKMRGVLPPIRSVLDLGAGPGPSSFAAAEMGAESFLLVDANIKALEAARDLHELASGGRAQFSITKKNLEKEGGDIGGHYDLIVASRSMNELWNDRSDPAKRRAAFLEKLSGTLVEGGILLVMEPSALSTSRPALALRDLLLEKSSGNGLTCVAPCPGSYPCPIMSAGEGRTCHSTWKWMPTGITAALASEAGLDRDSVKSTWFALRKGGTQRVPDSRGEGLAGRIVSESMLNKGGRLRYIVCTDAGLATISARGDDAAAAEAGFPALARGDFIKAGGLERRAGENGFGFSAGSTLEITMKAPRA